MRKLLTIDCALCNSRTMPPTTETLIGSAEACDVLGIDRSTLSRWVALGHIAPALRLPGQTGAHLFDRADVERLARERAS